jgi:hypothetical protein
MENKKYDQIIQHLRQQKPEMTDAEMLTDSIMERITPKMKMSTPSFLLIVRAISSSAAIFLLGLFLYQQVNTTELNTISPIATVVEPKIEVRSECLQNAKSKEKNILEVYLCYIKMNSIKNQQFQSFYHQIRN